MREGDILFLSPEAPERLGSDRSEHAGYPSPSSEHVGYIRYPFVSITGKPREDLPINRGARIPHDKDI